MKEVVYSISKPNKLEDGRLTGIGCITDEDLIIAAISKNGKPYIRVFEDCLKDCHPIMLNFLLKNLLIKILCLK